MYRDYLNYVRTPMDFGTVKGKIAQYKTPAEFEADVRLVFENARKYNAPETEVREMARLLEMKFEEKWTKSVLPRMEELKVNEIEDQIAFKQSKADNVTMEAETRVDECCRLLLNRLQGLSEEIKYAQCLAAARCESLKENERLRLGWELTTLPPEQFQHAINLILMRHPGLVASMRDNTIELDLNKMDCLTLRQLQDFVQYCAKEKDKAEENGGPLETPPIRKRRRGCTSPRSKTYLSDIWDPCVVGGQKGGSTEYWCAQREGMEWPEVAFGIGLKPYEAEVEPFIPPNSEEASSLPFSSVFMNHTAPSLDLETPPGASPAHSRPEESLLSSPPSSTVSMNQVPMFLPMPQAQVERTTVCTQGEEIPVSAEMVMPSSYSVLSLTPHDVELIQQTLTTPRETPLPTESGPPNLHVTGLSLPTVTVPSTGIQAIPLVSGSHSTNQYPSLFTANIRPSVVPTRSGSTQPSSHPASAPLLYPYITNIPPLSIPPVPVSSPTTIPTSSGSPVENDAPPTSSPEL